jgi:hypothetical protein
VNSGGLVVEGELGGSEGGIRDKADGRDSSAGGMYRFHRSSAGCQYRLSTSRSLRKEEMGRIRTIWTYQYQKPKS